MTFLTLFLAFPPLLALEALAAFLGPLEAGLAALRAALAGFLALPGLVARFAGAASGRFVPRRRWRLESG